MRKHFLRAALAVAGVAGAVVLAPTANAASFTPGDVPGDPYAPGYAQGGSSYAQTGPNSADAPRASEASTNQTEACGSDPGENDHTLGLPKLVNLNTC
jgi:hypothetical protein